MALLRDYLIIIGSTLPYDFPADYVKQTARILAKNNQVIVFLWGESLSIKEILIKIFHENKLIKLIHKDGNIILFTPTHFLPFRRFEIIRQINLLLDVLLLKLYLRMKKYLSKKRIAWIVNYELYQMPKYLGTSYFSIYDCVEYFTSINKSIHLQIRFKEEKLIKNVKQIFVNSNILKQIHSRYFPSVIPQGFDLFTFKRKHRHSIVGRSFRLQSKYVIGYIGNINYRLDYNLLISLSTIFPEILFVLVGEVQINPSEDKFLNLNKKNTILFSKSNVVYIKKQSREYIPAMINKFDICIIPYDTKSEFNRYCYPMKLFEYFYMGKPVVASPIEELKRFPKFVKIGKNVSEWENHINHLLKHPWSSSYKKEQRALAIANSWEKKLEAISNIIGQTYRNGVK